MFASIAAVKAWRIITLFLVLLLGTDASAITCAPKTVSRARYYNPQVGRFWTMDTYEGRQSDPLSLHKYLYCHADPVNGRDPSGHSFILEFSITNAKRAGIAAATMGTISAGFTYAKTRSLKAAVWQGSKTAGLTGFAFLSPAFAASMLATLPAQVGLGVYNEDLTIKDSPEVAAYIAAAVALNYFFKTQAIPPDPAVVTGILRDASRTGIGNSGVGSATASEALMAGRAWVGDGFAVKMGGKAWVSANGLRQFRLPSYKPKQGRWQSNLEERAVNSGKWTANSHIDIIQGAGPNTALENAAAAGAAISSESEDEDEGY